MSTFNATINIGTPNPPTPTSPVRGSSLLEFSFYGCRDSVVSGTTEQLTGCTFLTDCDNTPLPGYENVNITEFPSGEIFITGLTFNPIGNQIKWIKVEVTDVANGNAEDNIDCQSKCQNIKINNIPAYTPTPTPTATSIPPTSTPTPTPTATSIPPTSTPTPTPTATVTSPTNTPTPTPTATPTGPTSTPTPTPTATIPAIYTFSLGYNVSAGIDACSDFLSSPTNYYSYNPPPLDNGTILYTGSTYPLTGNAITGYYSDGTNYGYVPGNSGVINGLTSCNAPTPTPTPTPTPIGQGFGTNTGTTFNTSTLACTTFVPPSTTLYLADDITPNVGDYFYTTALCLPGTEFAGNSNFYRVVKNPNLWALRISPFGDITEVVDCSSSPTPTPTPTPTVTPIPSYEYYIGLDYINATTACNSFDSDPQTPIYASDSNPAFVNQFFQDTNLTIPFVGTTDKYCWAPSLNLSNKYVGNVDNMGNTSSVSSC